VSLTLFHFFLQTLTIDLNRWDYEETKSSHESIKTFHLFRILSSLALTSVEFDSTNPKCSKDTYPLNVLEFIDGSASKGRETLESSSSATQDSTNESTTTQTLEIDTSHESNYCIWIEFVCFMATYCTFIISNCIFYIMMSIKIDYLHLLQKKLQISFK